MEKGATTMNHDALTSHSCMVAHLLDDHGLASDVVRPGVVRTKLRRPVHTWEVELVLFDNDLADCCSVKSINGNVYTYIMEV